MGGRVELCNTLVHAGIPVELRHVETENVDRRYVESGVISTELTRLISTDDNYMERGIAVRDNENADIGFLFLGAVVQTNPNIVLCGQVNQILASAESAFVAINVECTSPIGTVIAHEFGHLAGVYHDYDTNIIQGNPNGYFETPFSYGHGYIDSSNGLSTVMAYPPDGYEWQNVWSNPGKFFERTNVVAGTQAHEDAALVVTQTAPHMGSFRGGSEIYVSSDSTRPVISLNGDANIILEVRVDSYTELGATVTDNDPSYSGTVIIGGDTVNTNILGLYTITYNAPADAGGNTPIQVIRTVNVVDTVPPIITLTGDNPQTMELGAGYTELGATTDDGSAVAIDDIAFIDAIGSYSILYDSTDSAGNTATQVIRTVNVIDTIPPIFSFVPNNQTFEATGILTTLGLSDIGIATATDNTDLSPTITNDAPNSFPLGDTVITWTATDGTGNSATATQTVTVRDTVPPSITPVPFGVYVSVSADAPSAIDFEVPDAIDAVDATVTASCTPAPGSLLSPGVTVVMCTASDAAGNSASMSFTLNVNLSYAHSPQVLSADVTDSAVVLDWYRPTFGGDVTGYQILRSNATTTDMAVIWQGVSTFFVDYTVLPDTEYTYHAISVNGTQISAPSNAITVTTDPAGLVGLMAVSTDGAVTLTWNDVPGADRYVVRKSVAIDSLISRYAWFLGSDILTVTDHSVSAGETFVYHVVADDRTDYHDYLHYDFVKVTVE